MGAPKYLGDFAVLTPDKPAVINGTTGASLSYRELEERSNRFAQYLYALGLRRGERIAMLLENNLRCFEVAWAAFRSGLLLTAVNRYLTADEAAYIITDCDARVVVSSFAMRALAAQLSCAMPACERRLMLDGTIPGWDSYEQAIAAASAARLADEWLGATMFYSSGTTGRPKGVVRAQRACRIDEAPDLDTRMAMMRHYMFTAESIYLSPAPLYHAAPLNYTTNVQFCGGTVVFMEKFEPMPALALIDRYRITHSQWVPTMFIRLLKLSPGQRAGFDLRSHRVAIHAAAPCPVEVKRQMIEWWGPIVHEYYGGSEGAGLTAIDSHEALARPGSVGKALQGVIHICEGDGQGRPLPAGQDGLVYFERDAQPFHYHKDPEKTRAAQHPCHPLWSTLGDIGHLDADGYLYLTDRQSFMIISGGVNIYPQAIENALALHPGVGDVAVIGVPDPEMGEAVKVVIEPAAGVLPSAALAEELLAFVRGKVARFMVPRSLDFIDQMPRLPTGKLYKKVLRERYAKAPGHPDHPASHTAPAG
ncbi:acyl-CoA synthetase [Verminephrobacter eiseniae]|uniref:acyl-CoA synthetase n=1 Tax=Verminephrobacter eiseniae TaxID=364317 RepID=UPI00223815C5|nr:acyl-CoA synthetase [Verminephrobacter eiseniae]MCW5238364.1 acyl-CoA synthetase [Verminephrobacter eiseniae]